MTLHLDSFVMAFILGLLSIGLIWLVARKATSGVPSKTQAFTELIFSFIDGQVSAIFHGNRHSFVAPAALTVFIWVLMMNAMDFLPIDIMAKFYAILGLHVADSTEQPDEHWLVIEVQASGMLTLNGVSFTPAAVADRLDTSKTKVWVTVNPDATLQQALTAVDAMKAAGVRDVQLELLP